MELFRLREHDEPSRRPKQRLDVGSFWSLASGGHRLVSNLSNSEQSRAGQSGLNRPGCRLGLLSALGMLRVYDMNYISCCLCLGMIVGVLLLRREKVMPHAQRVMSAVHRGDDWWV